MRKFDLFMLAAWSLILFMLVNTSLLFGPAAKVPEPAFDELSARVQTIELRLDRIEGLLERLPPTE